MQWFYRDQASPPETQCWGDGSFLGASGPTITGGIENTDPGVTPFATLRGVRTVGFDAPPANPSLVDDQAAAWSGQVRTPLGVVVTPVVAEAANVVSVGAAAIVEGDTGKPNTLKFAVTLSQPATSTVTVGYTIRATGSATAPADFTAKSGTVTFTPAGGKTATVKYVSAKVAPDATVEPNETFEVVLSNPTGGYSLGNAIAVGTIIDDESGPKPSVSVGDASIWEGDVGKTASAYNNGSAIVSLSAPATTTVTVVVTASPGTASSGTDYKPVTKTLTFKPGPDVQGLRRRRATGSGVRAERDRSAHVVRADRWREPRPQRRHYLDPQRRLSVVRFGGPFAPTGHVCERNVKRGRPETSPKHTSDRQPQWVICSTRTS